MMIISKYFKEEEEEDILFLAAQKKGRIEERAKAQIAVAKAEKEMSRNTALKLKSSHIAVELIAEATGLSRRDRSSLK